MRFIVSEFVCCCSSLVFSSSLNAPFLMPFLIEKCLLLLSLAMKCLAYSYMVGCGTAMNNAGHRSYTALGGGLPVIQRGSTPLNCGSALYANEQLSLTSSGTSGNTLFHLTTELSIGSFAMCS